ncbi:MAG: zinc ABC transporter substrate-binding protein [Clostridiales bacterium]|nr:zinc ABC transporter substrate-binding protein [Clostridiales bacterium]
MKKIILLTIVLLTLSFSACSQSTVLEKPIIITSIVPMQTFIQNIVGDTYEVLSIVPPGANPATYQPTPMEMAKISDAEYYFSIEVPTELSNILPKVNEFNSSIKLYKVDELIQNEYPDNYFDEGNTMRDHHIWVSPKRVIALIQEMTTILIEDHPESKELFLKNSDQYLAQLIELDHYIEIVSEKIPNKTFIIYHPSYGYFAEDYGFEMIAIEEEGKEGTAKGIEEVVDYALDHDIKVIFHQAEVDSAQAETIAKEIGGKTLMLTPLSDKYIESTRAVIDIFSDVLK